MLKNFRRSYWLLTGFITKHFFKIALSAIVTTLILVFVPQLVQRLPSGKSTVRIGRVGQFTLTDMPVDIQRLIALGLTGIAVDGTAVPSLAKSWQIENEGKNYIFTLNTDFLWHDNRNFQAAQVNYHFDDVEVNVLAANKIEFKLKEPFAPFPTVVSAPIFRTTTKASRILRRAKSELIGTGDFQVRRVVRIGKNVSQIFLESPQEKRVYRFYTTETAAILGFKLGEVDQLEGIIDPKPLESWQQIAHTPQTRFDRYVAVFFNTQDPNLADKNLRQALTYAISLKPTDNTRALGPINPASWAYNPQVKPYASDIKKAQELIAKFKGDNDSPVTVRLDTSLAYLPVAESIKKSWEALGITTDVRVITYPPQDYQALLVVHQIPVDPDQYAFWHSTQPTNLTRLKNPKIDKLLEDGRKTIDQEERKQIYQDFQRFLVEESPAAFLFYQTSHTISRK